MERRGGLKAERRWIGAMEIGGWRWKDWEPRAWRWTEGGRLCLYTLEGGPAGELSARTRPAKTAVEVCGRSALVRAGDA